MVLGKGCFSHNGYLQIRPVLDFCCRRTRVAQPGDRVIDIASCLRGALLHSLPIWNGSARSAGMHTGRNLVAPLGICIKQSVNKSCHQYRFSNILISQLREERILRVPDLVLLDCSSSFLKRTQRFRTGMFPSWSKSVGISYSGGSVENSEPQSFDSYKKITMEGVLMKPKPSKP
jgi:hypothetical protein